MNTFSRGSNPYRRVPGYWVPEPSKAATQPEFPC